MQGRGEDQDEPDRFAGAKPFAQILLGVTAFWLVISALIFLFTLSYCSDDHPCDTGDRISILPLILPLLGPPALAAGLSLRAYRAASRLTMDVSQVFTRFCIALGLFVVWWGIFELVG